MTEPRSGRPGHPDDDGALPQHVQDAIRAALTRPATLDEALAERDTERDGLTDTETADAHTD